MLIRCRTFALPGDLAFLGYIKLDLAVNRGTRSRLNEKKIQLRGQLKDACQQKDPW